MNKPAFYKILVDLMEAAQECNTFDLIDEHLASTLVINYLHTVNRIAKHIYQAPCSALPDYTMLRSDNYTLTNRVFIVKLFENHPALKTLKERVSLYGNM